MSRFYLDKIGYKTISDKVLDENDSYNYNSDRAKRIIAEKKKYGFDYSDTWSLDRTMLEMLYERLKMYLSEADKIVDLSYHKYVFEDKELNQKELIELMIQKAEKVLKSENSDVDDFDFVLNYDFDEEDRRERELVKEENDIWAIWSLVHREMWW